MSSTKITTFDLSSDLDMATESTSQNILNTVNSMNDVIGGGVLADKVTLDEVKAVNDEIKNMIGTEIATQLSNLKNELMTAMSSSSSGCVRHIQRGTIKGTSTELNVTLTGFSDVSKMMVLLDGRDEKGNGDNYTESIFPYLKTLTTSKLTIGKPVGTYCEWLISYQVIEFY